MSLIFFYHNRPRLNESTSLQIHFLVKMKQRFQENILKGSSWSPDSTSALKHKFLSTDESAEPSIPVYFQFEFEIFSHNKKSSEFYSRSRLNE